jgi:hypothetical protein
MKAAPPGQGTEHFASLIVRTDEGQTEVADSAVTFPGHAPEYAVWDLSGADVSFTSDVTGGITTPAKPSGTRAASIDRLADVWALTNPTNITQHPPLTASVTITTGELAAIMPPAGLKYVFYKGAKPTASELKAAKPYGYRYRVRIPFKKEIAIVMKRGSASKTVRFKLETEVVIANLCQEVGSTRNHFYAYYGLVDGGTFVKIQKKGKPKGGTVGETWPNLEYCMGGRISEA